MKKIAFLKELEILQSTPRTLLPLKEAKKIWTWTFQAPGEVNGLGLIEREKNDLLITEGFMLKQKVGYSSATIDPLAFNRYVGECEDPTKIRFQWHSHGDISGDFFSEEKDIKDTIGKWTGEYLVSLVLNKRGEYRCRLDIFEPVYLGFEIPLLIVVPVEKEIQDFCQKEMEEKVEFSDGILGPIKGWFGRKKRNAGLGQEVNYLIWPMENFQAINQGEEEEKEQDG